MGYQIKFLPNKKTDPRWKIQFISYKKTDCKNPETKKPRREWDISKNRWLALGFYESMSIDDAKVRARQLNIQITIKRQEEQLLKAKDAQSRNYAVLPAEFVAEFEQIFVRKNDSQIEQRLRRTSRAQTIWRAAQRLIIAVNVEPSHWVYHSRQIHEYMINEKMSMRYAHSVLAFANLWGYFICHKMARPFLPVRPPRGYERMRLIEANYQKQSGVARASKPIGPDDLDRIANKINKKNFNWLFISVWFGLRPKEIDNLQNHDFWRVEELSSGRKIL